MNQAISPLQLYTTRNFAGLTESNHLASAYLTEPEKMEGVLAYAFGLQENNVMQLLTGGIGNTREISNREYQWHVHGQNKRAIEVIEEEKKITSFATSRAKNKHIDNSSIEDDRDITELAKLLLNLQPSELSYQERLNVGYAIKYEYQGSGMVSDETKKTKGGQVGADFIINGRLDSIVQEVGKEKTVYYKLTLNMTNLKSGIIAWTNHKEIRKAYKKKSIGL
jgi:hypothetical protein